MYTLGAFMVSSDDDMRPYALVEGSPESLDRAEISRGRLHKSGANGYLHKSFDLLTSFRDVLGKRVSELPGNYESGELLRDTAMDLETNVADLHHFNDVYVLDNFRPAVTNKNWRIDCGVAGYDNRLGLPPFFPTRLRFEDYIFRLWIQQDGVVY